VMGSPKIAQAKPVFLRDMEEAALDALRNDRYVMGENVFKFEEEFARYVGTRHAVSTSSGTNALQLVLLALNLKGKKIVTSPFSFVASANAVIQADGVPVFGDISEEDYCLDSREAEKQLQAGAAGLLPVHLFGHPAEMAAFRELSERYHVPVIEDACQAHGARYEGKQAGNLGVAAAFSFYPSKNMTVLGDGGMVTTNDEAVAGSVKKLRDCGRISRYEHDVIGYTSRLNSINAAIGRVQLRHLDEWNKRRREVAGIYTRMLEGSVVTPPRGDQVAEPVFHQYVIRTPKRNSLKLHLQENGIETGIHYPIPIHLQPVYVERYGYEQGAFPRSERLASECLSLPMHPSLSDEEASYVAESVVKFHQKAGM
jgi:perosamine synthetase